MTDQPFTTFQLLQYALVFEHYRDPGTPVSLLWQVHASTEEKRFQLHRLLVESVPTSKVFLYNTTGSIAVQDLEDRHLVKELDGGPLDQAGKCLTAFTISEHNDLRTLSADNARKHYQSVVDAFAEYIDRSIAEYETGTLVGSP